MRSKGEAGRPHQSRPTRHVPVWLALSVCTESREHRPADPIRNVADVQVRQIAVSVGGANPTPVAKRARK